MSWEIDSKVHHCYPQQRLGLFPSDEDRDAGSVWRCDTCGRRWEIVERAGAQTGARWREAEPACVCERKEVGLPGGGEWLPGRRNPLCFLHREAS